MNEQPNQQSIEPETEIRPEQKIVIQQPKKTFWETIFEELQKGLIRIVFLIIQIAAIVIVLLFLYNSLLQKTQPVTTFFQATFNDLRYKTYLLAHPNAAPSHGTSDGKALPGFPLIDELRYLGPNTAVYETEEFQVVLKRMELSPDAQYEEEKYYAVLERQLRNPSLWNVITDFLGKEKVVYSHQCLHLGDSYWFIYKIDADQMIVGRFVEETEARQFPLVWEVGK